MIPKFRAWIPADKRMVRVSEIDLDRGIIRYWKELGDSTNIFMESCSFLSCELMQSTGLKDKHGVEIFEGDIVSVSEYYDARDEWVKNSDLTIKYKTGAFYMFQGDDLHLELYEGVDLGAEIIGNKFEGVKGGE